MKRLVAVGEQAPDFTLEGSDDGTHTLATTLEDSHVLLIFYPGNNTPG